MAAAAAVRETVAMRSATIADCERVWEWNFAPDVRAQSKASPAVTFLQHVRWYQQRLDSGDPMWVIEECGIAVGVVRIDRMPGFGRISIALSSRARGRGIGRRAITTACMVWNGPVVAEILATNRTSRSCFEACGFAAAATDATIATYTWSP